MGLVTAYCPLTTTGAGRLVVQAAGAARFVVDCKVKPVALVDQVKIASPLTAAIANCGGGTGKEMANTVPLPPLPPVPAVPNNVLPDTIRLAPGAAPSANPVNL